MKTQQKIKHDSNCASFLKIQSYKILRAIRYEAPNLPFDGYGQGQLEVT